MTTTKLRDDRLFLVDSKEDDTVFLALKPEFRDGHMCWFDTMRPRMKPGVMVSSSTESAEFKGEDGARYKFRVCALKDYDALVRPRVEGNPSFSDEKSLHQHYLSTFSF